MRLNLSLELSEEQTAELTDYIEKMLPTLINEYFFSNPNELNKIIRESVRGQLKATACEIFQGKDIRNILSERIIKQLFNDEIVKEDGSKVEQQLNDIKENYCSSDDYYYKSPISQEYMWKHNGDYIVNYSDGTTKNLSEEIRNLERENTKLVNNLIKYVEHSGILKENK